MSEERQTEVLLYLSHVNFCWNVIAGNIVHLRDVNFYHRNVISSYTLQLHSQFTLHVVLCSQTIFKPKA